ncbi:MAG TPA: KR domain-containing protein, partial [Phytomonospora sp.]
AVEHKATEEYITASGVPHVFLRNGWYLENYTENLAPALEHGVLLGSAENGLVSAAARADYAAAAAVVLTADAPEEIYELAGDRGCTMAELAAEVSRASGKEITYRDLPQAEYYAALTGAGVPAGYADLLADSDAGVAKGELHATDAVLSRLIGRPTTPLADAVAAAIKA